MATKARKKAKLSRKSIATRKSIPSPASVQTPRVGEDPKLLAGTPGPGPKIGDSSYESPQDDAKSRGVPTSDSDGTKAASRPRRAGGKKRAKASGIQKAQISDAVVWVTDGRNPGKCRPALVMRTTDPESANAERSPIDLVAFPDSGKFPNNDHLGAVAHREGVLYSENLEPGTWHWPEDSENLLAKKAKSDTLALDQDAVKKAAAKR